jgi:hypothetical protein
MIHGVDRFYPYIGLRVVEGRGSKQCIHHRTLVPGYTLRYIERSVLPYASLCQPLPQPESTNGTGSARQWRPCTPAMATGLTDHVWTLREVLLFRVPPWPQPQAL